MYIYYTACGQDENGRGEEERENIAAVRDDLRVSVVTRALRGEKIRPPRYFSTCCEFAITIHTPSELSRASITICRHIWNDYFWKKTFFFCHLTRFFFLFFLLLLIHCRNDTNVRRRRLKVLKSKIISRKSTNAIQNQKNLFFFFQKKLLTQPAEVILFIYLVKFSGLYYEISFDELRRNDDNRFRRNRRFFFCRAIFRWFSPTR